MPTLILICGLPGAGKTTLAKELETSRSAFRFCPDAWIVRLLAEGYETAERDRLRDPVESLQWDMARRLLELGVSVILENGFWTKAERDRYRDDARAMGARVELYCLDIPTEELWRRIEKRNARLPQSEFPLTRAEFDSYLPFWEPANAEELATYDNGVVG